MNTIASDDTIQWLLGADNPPVRYLTLVHLMGREPESPEAREAKSQLMNYEVTRETLARGAEFWHPEGTYDGKGISEKLPKEASALKQACTDAGVRVTDFAVNAWDGVYGGCPVRAQDREKYLEQVHRMIEFAAAIDCGAGITLSGTVEERLSRSQMRRNLVRALGDAIRIAWS